MCAREWPEWVRVCQQTFQQARLKVDMWLGHGEPSKVTQHATDMVTFLATGDHPRAKVDQMLEPRLNTLGTAPINRQTASNQRQDGAIDQSRKHLREIQCRTWRITFEQSSTFATDLTDVGLK